LPPPLSSFPSDPSEHSTDAYLTEEGYYSGAHRVTTTREEEEDDEDDDHDDDGPPDDDTDAESSSRDEKRHRRRELGAASSSGLVRSSFVTTSASAAETASVTTAMSLSLAALQGDPPGGTRESNIEDDNDDDCFRGPLGGGGGTTTTTTRPAILPSSLPIRAMSAALKRLSLAEQFQIPQHLIDALYGDGDKDKAIKQRHKEQRHPLTPPSNAEREGTGPSPDKADPAARAADAAAAFAAGRAPRIQLRRSQLACVPSVRLVSSGEYDGDGDDDDDGDSDAILRSRRSSQEDEDGSTLPSTTAADPNNSNANAADYSHHHHSGSDDSARQQHPSPWNGTGNVVEGRLAASQRPSNGARTDSDAVAAIIQSISDELHHVDQIVSTSGGDDDDDGNRDIFPDESLSPTMSLFLGGESSSGIAASATIPPSDTMQAVVVSRSTSTTTTTHASSSYRYLPKSGTNQAVTSDPSATTTAAAARDATSSSSSGYGIRQSDTMHAVVNGRPVTAAPAAGDGLFPPNLMLSLTVPSPSARSAASARNRNSVGLIPPPAASNRTKSPPPASPDRTLVVSPGRIPAYPIDLSDAPSPPQERDLRIHERHSFSVPEDRIRALYDESDAHPASTWQHRRTMSSSPTARLGRSVSPYARGRGETKAGDRDVIERARIAIAASVSATSKASRRDDANDDVVGRRLPQHPTPPQPPSHHETFVVQGMRNIMDGPPRRPPVPAVSVSSRASGVTNSSVEPDSDAAVVVLPHAQHHRESCGRFEDAGMTPSASDLEAAATPRTKPGAAPRDVGSRDRSTQFVSTSFVANPSSREDEDYDTWLDSALATQTFDEPRAEDDGDGDVGGGTGSSDDPRTRSLFKDDGNDDDDDDDDDTEPLRDWLDSVLP
jgi:hypothetical protein